MAKILLVEDDQDLLKVYERLLTIEKHQVELAQNGQECLEKAKAFKPDLIMLDIMMPVMDGIEALRQLKASEELKHIPVIMLTNVDEESTQHMARGLGANDYLVKLNFSPDEVLAKVRRELGLPTNS